MGKKRFEAILATAVLAFVLAANVSAKTPANGTKRTESVLTYEAVGDGTPTPEKIEREREILQERAERIDEEATVTVEEDGTVLATFPNAEVDAETLERFGRKGRLTFENEDGDMILTNDDVESAEAVEERNSLGNVEDFVDVRFDEDGAKTFELATSLMIGERIVIALDGEKISAPVVAETCADGRCRISGFSRSEAKSLADDLNLGELPYEIELADENEEASENEGEAIPLFGRK